MAQVHTQLFPERCHLEASSKRQSVVESLRAPPKGTTRSLKGVRQRRRLRLKLAAVDTGVLVAGERAFLLPQ